MLDLFASAPKDLRKARLQDYRQYLIEHDGEMNVQERTLSRREEAMRRYETPPNTIGAMNGTEFQEQYVSFDRGRATSPEMLLLLALVKANSAEAYGVAQNYQRALSRALKNEDDSELRILLQEDYHTRILLSSANCYGIEVREPFHPPSAFRILIGGIATAPMAMARPFVLAGEIIATLVFTKLLFVAERVLKDAPETRDAIVERLTEICTDERGHISYNRMLMGPAELAQTRLVLPVAVRMMAGVFREAAALDAYPFNVFQELPLITDSKTLPESVRRGAFVA